MDEQGQRAPALLCERREANVESKGISYGTGISACRKDPQWQQALALLSGALDAKGEPAVINYIVGSFAYRKGG